MMSFNYDVLPARIIFRVGALAELPAEISRLGFRALVLSTPEQAQTAKEVAQLAGERAVGVFSKAAMHVPVEIASEAKEQAQRLLADCCVAVGGGSTIGLGKAIALEFGLPIIAVPTTYAGSEMTPIWGVTQAGLKRTGRDSRALPKTVIYDPTLTVSLRPKQAGVSGMNAVAHCVEALYAKDANPIISLMAEEGIRALSHGLPKLIDAPADLDARSQALYGAWLAGSSLGTVGMALHHKLCHTLGGSFGLPHAETHAVLIAYVAAYNQSHAPEALARVAAALGAENAADGLFDLARRVGAPNGLRELGFDEADLDRAVSLAMRDAYYNPRPLTAGGLSRLLQGAIAGQPPSTLDI